MILPFLLWFNLFKHWQKMIANDKGKGFLILFLLKGLELLALFWNQYLGQIHVSHFFLLFFISVSFLFRFHFWLFFSCLCKCKGTTLPLNFSIKTCRTILRYRSLLLISYFPKLKRMSYWLFSLLPHSD